jgi:sugar porter (SP) family MFS transporter
MIFMPFSPRWLVHHGREDEARKTLALLRKLPQEHELVEIEFLEIKAQSIFEKRTTAEHFPNLSAPTAWNTLKLQFVAIGSLFRTKPMFRRVIVATLTMTFQQWTGINAVLYYAPSIFKNLGLSSNSVSLLATGVVGVVMLIATLPAVLYIDKIGRKPILIGGAFGMAFCHFVIGIITARDQSDWAAHSAAGWAAVTFVWIFVAFFGASWGPASWILVAEIWPLSARPYGIALGTSANWMNNFIVGQVTPDMLSHITYGTYVFFGLMTTLAAAFIYFLVPETKCLTLEEMDVVFGSAGLAAKDADRMAGIQREVGLDDLLHGGKHADSGSDRGVSEKPPVLAGADEIEKV